MSLKTRSKTQTLSLFFDFNNTGSVYFSLKKIQKILFYHSQISIELISLLGDVGELMCGWFCDVEMLLGLVGTALLSSEETGSGTICLLCLR